MQSRVHLPCPIQGFSESGIWGARIVPISTLVVVLAIVSKAAPDGCGSHVMLMTMPTICPMVSTMANDKKRRKKPAPPADKIVPNDPTSISFVRGLMARGEAAKADAQGRLPPGATHEILGETADGLPIVVRRRFSKH